ncbi:unnamed protein product [Microthlaspi erraticum]|uniref:FBD domain-containing protein n=1 Tax=Microthlaspi erraticum TaxID=1685480 RepID=A0A6D2JF73_9BRAS|nr:unnamed protein product [Microthlaspi erraticum]
MDRISGLADELLIKILLLVPTKVAVSTSILSKRWEYLWMWLPKLEFGHRHSSPSESKSLECFLERNLPLHRAPVIKTLRLDLDSDFKSENIKMWVMVAVSHCIRKLKIVYSSYPEKPNILPSNLYTSKSLVTLKLQGDILLDAPRMVSLPSLKILQLTEVRYSSEESFQRLLSNSPVLEDPSVELNCDTHAMGKLTVVVPPLQRLSLYIPADYEIVGVVIKTPSLKYFKLIDYNTESHYYLIENMPDLIEAHLDVEFPNIESLMASVTSVKRLAICSEAMYGEGVAFTQLEHLKLCSCKEHLPNLLFRLLEDSSNLQVLKIFHMSTAHELTGMGYLNLPSTVPECLFSSLQTLNWWGYKGTPEEREIVVYILQNAHHLKTAAITSFEHEVPKFEMIKELAQSSRASATCQLMFH